MAIRPSMTEVVATMRRHGQAATDDVFDGVTFWTDDQLQEIADHAGTRGLVRLHRANNAGTIFRLITPKSAVIENDFLVYDTNDVLIGSNTCTYNQSRNEVQFGTALPGTDYQVEALVINLYDALADLWLQKAEQRFNYIDWKAQNNKMNMGQEYQHCVERSAYYRARTVRTFKRDGRGKWWTASG